MHLSTNVVLSSKIKEGWHPPLVECILINCDAVLCEAKPGCGLGSVARNFRGRVLGVWASYAKGVFSGRSS